LKTKQNASGTSSPKAIAEAFSKYYFLSLEARASQEIKSYL